MGLYIFCSSASFVNLHPSLSKKIASLRTFPDKGLPKIFTNLFGVFILFSFSRINGVSPAIASFILELKLFLSLFGC